MYILSNLIFTSGVSLVIVIATYLLQYCSSISPCNIEFDKRRSSEIKLMIQYNRLFNKIFNTAMLLIMLCVTASIILEASGFMLFIVMLEFIYFVFNVIVMSAMYIRSKIYWYRLENFKVEKMRKNNVKKC